MQKRRYMIPAVVLVGLMAAGAGGFALSNTAQDSQPQAAAPEVATAAVERTDLVERVEVKGTLGYGSLRSIGTELAGTLTSVADPGATLSAGSEIMRVNDKPVIAMRGSLPAWRSFEPGMSNGRDVLQLEQNLASFGYFEPEPDEHFDWNTAAAVAKWQQDIGLPWDTTLELGRVVFLPSDVRVNKQLAKPGDQASTAALEVTETTLFVTAEVQSKFRDLLSVGEEVSITLPNGETTTGVVEAVEPPVEKEDKSGQQSVKVPVRISLTDPAAAEAYVNVTVNVSATRTVAEDVLAVPVRALLAQPGGKFAVEVVKGDTVTRVPVEVGRFADDMVEITDGELSAGDRVVVGE